MASPKRRLLENADGDFFVDDSCIDCGTCRWMAPEVFNRSGHQSVVHRQPSGDPARALMASIACPTASIGFTEKHDARGARDAFPAPYGDDPRVRHCGFHAESSFGAASWLYLREAGNVLVDSPRFSKPLAKRIHALGGAKLMFLTHRDDVADHAQWAAELKCERVMHVDDVTGGTREVERQLSGQDPVFLDDELLVIPVPGHTQGSAVLLAGGAYLFTGDHLAWRKPDELYAFRGACWYSWEEQLESMKRMAARLDAHPVTQVLPGHGSPGPYSRARIDACIEWMAQR